MLLTPVWTAVKCSCTSLWKVTRIKRMMKRKIHCQSSLAQQRWNQKLLPKRESRQQWVRSCESSDHNSEPWKRCKNPKLHIRGGRGNKNTCYNTHGLLLKPFKKPFKTLWASADFCRSFLNPNPWGAWSHLEDKHQHLVFFSVPFGILSRV